MTTTSFQNFAVLIAVVVGEISKNVASNEFSCFDLAPYAVNPQYLKTLTGGGDIPNDAAVYFEFPSTFVAGEIVYCLRDVLIPNSVGGNPCSDSEECWLAVGNRAGTTARGFSAAQYNCLCSSSEMNPSTAASSRDLAPDACGLQDEKSWGLTCRDAANGRSSILEDGSSVASNYSSAYVHICPEMSSNCGVCQEGGGVNPSFVVGVQWVSNLQSQCMNNPFANYADYCSTGLTTSSIVGMAAGGALLLAAVGGLCYYYAVVRRRRDAAMTGKHHGDTDETKYSDVEGQRNRKSDVPPVEEISITTDGSPVE